MDYKYDARKKHYISRVKEYIEAVPDMKTEKSDDFCNGSVGTDFIKTQ